MNDRDEGRLREMLDAAKKAQRFVAGKTLAMLEQDEFFAAALSYVIQNIGESASRVSSEVQQQFTQIAWREIIGMRNILVHDYLNTRYDILWNAATISVPELVRQLEAILPPFVDEDVESNPDDV
ncbi:MAG: DUF86 domain-containing protein [Chloroflexi bacterium]|uniref:HepT-like ribonuclease domain-containing protein n=1 Tax=Candidatus Flexifilum breve TaxID=3140694 RepID=UPI003137233B|nr:DUF86 domain-containing protein [Chloroflexota bacterium]